MNATTSSAKTFSQPQLWDTTSTTTASDKSYTPVILEPQQWCQYPRDGQILITPLITLQPVKPAQCSRTKSSYIASPRPEVPSEIPFQHCDIRFTKEAEYCDNWSTSSPSLLNIASSKSFFPFLSLLKFWQNFGLTKVSLKFSCIFYQSHTFWSLCYDPAMRYSKSASSN